MQVFSQRISNNYQLTVHSLSLSHRHTQDTHHKAPTETRPVRTKYEKQMQMSDLPNGKQNTPYLCVSSKVTFYQGNMIILEKHQESPGALGLLIHSLRCSQMVVRVTHCLTLLGNEGFLGHKLSSSKTRQCRGKSISWLPQTGSGLQPAIHEVRIFLDLCSHCCCCC